MECNRGTRMNKEILIELYRSKDRKRKMLLNELYHKQIHLKLSQTFIANMINRDLGVENLIQADDIRYCKFYFKNEIESPIQDIKQEKKITNHIQNIPRHFEKIEISNDSTVDWDVAEEVTYEEFIPQLKHKQK